MNLAAGRYFSADSGGVVEKPAVLYVEGKDDAHFVDEVLAELAVDPAQLQLVFTAGSGEIAENLAAIVKSSAYVRRQVTRIGVIRDNDAKPAKSLGLVHKALKELGLPQPGAGEVSDFDGNRRLGVFMVPRPEVTGAIEELLLETIQADNRLQKLQEVFDAVVAEHGHLPKGGKRLMQMYLALRDPLRRGAGLAFREGHFPKDHDALEPFRQFVQKLLA